MFSFQRTSRVARPYFVHRSRNYILPRSPLDCNDQFLPFRSLPSYSLSRPPLLPKQELHHNPGQQSLQCTKFPTRTYRGAPHDEEPLCAIRAYQPKFNGFPVSMNVLKLLRVIGQLIRELS